MNDTKYSYTTDVPISLEQGGYELRIKKLTNTAQAPFKAHDHDAGFDLYADEDVSIKVGGTVLVSAGIAMEIPKGFVGLIWDRSSMGVKGIHRFAGVIDSGYRGEVKVCLSNFSYGLKDWPHYHVQYGLKRGDRIAQLVVQQIPLMRVIEVEELEDSSRACGGFGSSGK